MSLFKFEMSIDYLSRIESEFPVFWEFYPLQKLNVPPHVFVLLAHKGAPEEMQIRLLDRMYQQLGTTFRLMPVRCTMVESRKLPPVFPELTMKDIILEWYQELLREHGELRQNLVARAFTLVYVTNKTLLSIFP